MTGVTTLVNMATNTAIRGVKDIAGVGDMPFHLALPILKRIENPQQLREIEINCSHIEEQSKDLWVAFIARDIPDWKQKIIEPKNPRSWHKVYRYLQRKEEQKAADDEEALRIAMQGVDTKKEQSKAVFVNKTLAHPRGPDEPSKYVDGVKRDHHHRPNLKNARNGKQVIEAIRLRSHAAATERFALAKPMPAPAQQLAAGMRQIRQVPESMLSEMRRENLVIKPRELLPHEKAAQRPEHRGQQYQRKVITPRGRLANAKQQQDAAAAARMKAIQENEAKLRALTQPKKPVSASSPPTTQQKSKATYSPPIPAVNTRATKASPPAPTLPSSSGQIRDASPASPAPQIVRKRPAATPSIFNTSAKRRRV